MDRGPRAADPVVRVRDLDKRFRRADGPVVHAIDGVSLDVARGEFVVLLGPSGCGKTTLLRAVAGLETPDRGSIVLDGRTVYAADERIEVPPEHRRLSMVFQSYALWPHMTAFGNVAHPLQSRRDRPSRAEVARRVRAALELVGIGELERQYPGQLSGGQQQRVALARALVADDELVLFDEPLSNVDAKVREQLRLEIVGMQRELGFSALFVTHDQTEAMELAHRIAVLDAGRIVQFAAPQEIYTRPATPYVARFVGAINEAVGTVRSVVGDTVVVDTPDGAVVATAAAPGTAVGDEVTAMWRPECGTLSTDEPSLANRWSATVRTVLFVGAHTEYLVALDGPGAATTVRLWSPRPDLATAGAAAWVAVDPAQVRVLPLRPHPQPATAPSLAGAR